MGQAARLPPAATMSDALAAWLATRGAIANDVALLERAQAAPMAWAARDGHRRYINEHDARRAQGITRAQCMRSALRNVRERADDRPSLDVAALLALTSVALGARVEMRSDVAFAKHGDDTYGTARLGEFATCLAGIDDTSLPVLVRACRAYLDVCFFHPFIDGNGRAARLALDFVLSRTRCRFDLVTPLFCVLRPAGDVESHLSFVRVACTIAHASAHRIQRAPEESHA